MPLRGKQLPLFTGVMVVLAFGMPDYCYSFNDRHVGDLRRWPESHRPVGYYVNLNCAPAWAGKAIKNAFQSWQDVAGSFISFAYKRTTTPSREGYPYHQGNADGKSVLGWVSIGGDTLATTCFFVGHPGIQSRPWDIAESGIASNINKRLEHNRCVERL